MGRLGGYVTASRYDSHAMNAKARRAFRDSFDEQARAEAAARGEEITEDEAWRRGHYLYRAHFARMAVERERLRKVVNRRRRLEAEAEAEGLGIPVPQFVPIPEAPPVPELPRPVALRVANERAAAERATRIMYMRAAGASFQLIADRFGISRQRVYQIVRAAKAEG